MAENQFGIGVPCETLEAIKITQEPGPVQKLVVSETTNTTATIAWEKPAHDSGSRISGYVVELTPKDTDDWKEVGIVKTLSHKVKFS